jgi:enterochelin esterase-like enzyme
MSVKTSAAVAVAAILACASVAMPVAQGRGGRGGGVALPAGGGTRNGTIEKITVHGKSLEGNLEGDSPDRDVLVYLPPSYINDQARRFPVVYLLHGYGGRETTFTERLAKLAESGDRLDLAQGFSSAIYVMPGAYTLHKGSMYSDSVTTGNWEKFIAEDLVAYTDSHYRTLPTRMSRGLAGHSMGGYGAIKIGMKRPDVFASLYLMSSCCLAANRNPSAQSMAAAEAVKTREQAVEAASAPGFGVSTTLAEAAAWSPNPANPPLFFDLPVKDGKVRPEIVAKWAANAPLEMVEKYADNLKKYYAIAMEVGLQDSLLKSNQQLHEAMTRLNIPHRYEEYEGDHTNHVKDRIDRNVLPFFARHLAAPANPTSPAPGADRLAPATK